MKWLPCFFLSATLFKPFFLTSTICLACNLRSDIASMHSAIRVFQPCFMKQGVVVAREFVAKLAQSSELR